MVPKPVRRHILALKGIVVGENINKIFLVVLHRKRLMFDCKRLFRRSTSAHIMTHEEERDSIDEKAGFRISNPLANTTTAEVDPRCILNGGGIRKNAVQPPISSRGFLGEKANEIFYYQEKIIFPRTKCLMGLCRKTKKSAAKNQISKRRWRGRTASELNQIFKVQG